MSFRNPCPEEPETEPLPTPVNDSDRAKTVWFLTGTAVLLIVSIFLILLLGTDGSSGLLRSYSKVDHSKHAGLVLPDLQTDAGQFFYSAVKDEASYYDWRFAASSARAEGGAFAAATKLAKQNVDVIFIDPDPADTNTLQSLDQITESTGIPCVILLDGGEENNLASPSVWCDLQYLGTDMAYKCNPGKVFIISGSENGNETRKIESGLLYDTHYGLYRNDKIRVEGISYADENRDIEKTVSQALQSNPDLSTFIVTAPELVYVTLATLEQAGYLGDLICYTKETDISKLRECTNQVTVIYEYFSIYDLSYYWTMAAADKLEYEIASQHYTVYPYSW